MIILLSLYFQLYCLLCNFILDIFNFIILGIYFILLDISLSPSSLISHSINKYIILQRFNSDSFDM